MKIKEIPSFYRKLFALVLPVAVQNLISAVVCGGLQVRTAK